ncbi:phosphate acyltransferase PlsX [uncultured Gilvimarinus sp.]|uniref:phosphate acyltransferase PlsX n=1 Tax=uncultured Gilvimarinus sp. TaxID=1689143 RepID=UPI0030EDE7FC
MSEPIRLAVDAMSGDFGPRIAIPAAIEFARTFPDVQLLLFGQRSAMARECPATTPKNIEFVDVPDVVAMDADPRQALRLGDTSSMWQALQAVARGDARACISAGNTGALMLMSRRVVGMMSGVEVPAICKAMPVRKGLTLMLDLGANIHCSSSQLLQFATMGSVLARASGVAEPQVALLNIGTEAGKGTTTIRDAATLLAGSGEFTYAGFVEADAIYSGAVQVIVCDGFSGNIALKASEGVARLIAGRIEESFKSGFGRVIAPLAWPLIRRWRAELNPDAYNGAILAGLAGTVIKSHGGASVAATVNALRLAYEQAEFDSVAKVAHVLGGA